MREAAPPLMKQFSVVFFFFFLGVRGDLDFGGTLSAF